AHEGENAVGNGGQLTRSEVGVIERDWKEAALQSRIGIDALKRKWVERLGIGFAGTVATPRAQSPVQIPRNAWKRRREIPPVGIDLDELGDAHASQADTHGEEVLSVLRFFAVEVQSPKYRVRQCEIGNLLTCSGPDFVRNRIQNSKLFGDCSIQGTEIQARK